LTDEYWNEVSYATPVPSPDASEAVNTAVIKTLTQLYSSNADPKTLMTACDAQVSGYLNNSVPGGIS